MSSGDQMCPCTVCGELGHWEAKHAGDYEQLQQTKAMLRVVLDCIDYTQGNCKVNSMVGAEIAPDILKKARETL